MIIALAGMLLIGAGILSMRQRAVEEYGSVGRVEEIEETQEL